MCVRACALLSKLTHDGQRRINAEFPAPTRDSGRGPVTRHYHARLPQNKRSAGRSYPHLARRLMARAAAPSLSYIQ